MQPLPEEYQEEFKEEGHQEEYKEETKNASEVSEAKSKALKLEKDLQRYESRLLECSCPISGQIFGHPVKLRLEGDLEGQATGHTFEEVSINTWRYSGNTFSHCCPITRIPFIGYIKDNAMIEKVSAFLEENKEKGMQRYNCDTTKVIAAPIRPDSALSARENARAVSRESLELAAFRGAFTAAMGGLFNMAFSAIGASVMGDQHREIERQVLISFEGGFITHLVVAYASIAYQRYIDFRPFTKQEVRAFAFCYVAALVFSIPLGRLMVTFNEQNSIALLMIKQLLGMGLMGFVVAVLLKDELLNAYQQYLSSRRSTVEITLPPAEATPTASSLSLPLPAYQLRDLESGGPELHPA